MADVKWIKIVTGIFDDEKIKLIEAMPEADAIIVIWFKLLCMAGKQNNGGVFMLNDKIAYTDEMLSTIFRRPLNTVRLALTTFERFGMVEIINNTITIPNWEKYQSADKLAELKEYNRLAQQRSRAKRKELAAVNDTSMTCQRSQGTDIDTDIEGDKEKDIYTRGSGMDTECIQDVSRMATNGKPTVNQTATQYRLGKGSLGKVSIDSNVGDKSPRTQKAEQEAKPYKHIVDYLNAKAGTQYKASCKDTRAKIDARLAENFTVEDFEKVIDKKCEEWRGTEWEKFLRPLTLFGPKFESYLNAKIISSNKATAKPNRARDLGNKRTYTAEEIDSMGYDLLGGD